MPAPKQAAHLTTPPMILDIVVAAMDACKAWRMRQSALPDLDPAMAKLEDALMPMLIWHAHVLGGTPPSEP